MQSYDFVAHEIPRIRLTKEATPGIRLDYEQMLVVFNQRNEPYAH